MTALLRAEKEAWLAMYTAGRALSRLSLAQVRAIELAGHDSKEKKDGAHAMTMLLLRLYRQFMWEDRCTKNCR